MSLLRPSRALAAGLAALGLVGIAGDAFAKNNRYTGTDITGYNRTHHRYRRDGLGAGPAIAGAALGIAGLAAAGVAANRSYNGYPAYGYGDGDGDGYGPRYGRPRYGYDYIPDRGYYGPY